MNVFRNENVSKEYRFKYQQGRNSKLKITTIENFNKISVYYGVVNFFLFFKKMHLKDCANFEK